MTSKIDGKNIRSFFNQTGDSGFKNKCNCPENPQVSRSFVIDISNVAKHTLYWIDPWVHNIISSDMNGCQCKIIVNATLEHNYGKYC